MIKVVVCGVLGRMGSTVGRLVNEAQDLTLVGGIDLRGGSIYGMDVVESARIRELLLGRKPDVLIDFTTPAATVSTVQAAAENGKALVIGTTGFSPEQRAEMTRAIEGNAELYCDHRFVELESLAPLVKLEPRASVSHQETWDLYKGLDSLPSDIQKMISPT